MKKTITVIFLTVLLLLFLTGCGHEHVWNEATCTEPRTCAECGETEGEALGHIWSDATCTKPQTCERCGITQGSVIAHSWEPATCTEQERCSVCGTTRGKALGHDVPNLSCEEGGICTRCGVEVGALGHNWKAATCTEAKTCSRCGLTEGDALGHTTEDGVCSRCKEEVYAVHSGHGDDVVSGITVGDNLYRIHFTHSGSRNFIVRSYDKTDDKNLLVNEIGLYDGYVLLMGKSPFMIEINANGDWTFLIEPIGSTNSTSFSGKGDYVTDKMTTSTGVWHFTHTGKSNFIVHAFTTDGMALVINEIGQYDGKVRIDVPAGSLMLLEIEGDGDWTAEKVQ